MAAVALTVTGCGQATAGRAVPGAERPSPVSTARSTTTTTAEFVPDYSNTALCKLLTAQEAEGLGGAPEGKPLNSTADGHAQCQWSADTSVTLGFQKGVHSTDARTDPGYTNTPTTVQGLSAMQSVTTDPIEICQILVDVSPDAVIYGVAANRSGGEGKYQPCDVANQLINIVIPKVTQR